MATILTVLGLACGTGGALAIASNADHHAAAGASSGQYCNKKGQGMGNGKCKGHQGSGGDMQQNGGNRHGHRAGHRHARGH
jgi:hypothetical protein